MNERTLTFDRVSRMVGILTEPDADFDPGRPCFVLLNAGLVHRVGPGRTSVQLARRLADLGFASLRFDHTGKGDSMPRVDASPFVEASARETAEVLDRLESEIGASRFILVGLCSGAVTAFRVARDDRRVVGAVMMNGQVYEQNAEWDRFVYNRGWARWYLKGALFRRDSWRRFLTGRIHYRRLLGVLARQVRNRLRPPQAVKQVADRLTAEVDSVIGRGVRLLLVYAQNDHTMDYLEIMFGRRLEALIAEGALRRIIIPGADHTFTLRRHQQALMLSIESWAREYYSASRTPALIQS